MVSVKNSFRSILFLLFIFFSILPVNKSLSWGFESHESIAEQAATWLPSPWKETLKRYQFDLRDGSILPDLRKSSDPDERPRHWDDADIPHKDYNISADSADYQYGVISWAIENATKDLIQALQNNNDTSYIVELFGVISHYAADATNPLHATSNYNGQFTGNNGIHSRFESELIARNYGTIFNNITVKKLNLVDPYNETKQIIASGLQVVPQILNADNKAKEKSRNIYNDKYYDIFFQEMFSLVKERITLAVQHTANLWYTALFQSGKLSNATTTMDTSTTSNFISKILSQQEATTNFSFEPIILMSFILIRRRMRS